MFTSSGGSSEAVSLSSSPKNPGPAAADGTGDSTTAIPALNTNAIPTITEKPEKPEKPEKRRKPSRAAQLIASAKQSLSSSSNSLSNEEKEFNRMLKDDPQVHSPGSTANAAGDSKPGPKSTFRVGVTEDRNKKCRRTMEDTHSYLYNFLPAQGSGVSTDSIQTSGSADELGDSDNGYFAIFDGHAGTFAADWCGKKLHLVLEENIRKHPNTPIPELLDLTFTNCDGQLEKLPVKNSGCTAVCAVLRWEERPTQNNTAPSEGGSGKVASPTNNNENTKPNTAPAAKTERHRVLYTANVGDARIVLCRNGKALRLSYDHKGSDENEGKRVANAGGLILNNRVNGVLAVTRALGDSYMKELVTGHPYTTETVLQPDADEFIILACDGLWDVCSDQEAVDLVRTVKDPQQSSKMLVDYALSRFSSDNLSCMIVRLDPTGKFEDAPVSPKKTQSSDEVAVQESSPSPNEASRDQKELTADIPPEKSTEKPAEPTSGAAASPGAKKE